MKLSKTATVEKEAFASNLLKSTKLTAANINESVKAQFGSPLRINRLYQLQREVRPDLAKKPVKPSRAKSTTTVVTTADRKGGVPIQSDGPRIVRFIPGESPKEFLTRAVEEMRQAGLCSALIVSSTDRYAVVDSAP